MFAIKQKARAHPGVAKGQVFLFIASMSLSQGSTTNTLTFAEGFCARHKIPPERFAQEVFKRVLYRRALPFVGVLKLLKHDYFSADFDLIYGVEHLRKMRDFKTEAERFNEHPGNRGCLRRQLRIRISTNRLKRLIKTTFEVSAADTQQSSIGEAA